MPSIDDRGPRADSPVVDAALVLVVVMWASTFTVFKIAWRDVDPVAFTSARFAAMTLFALVLLLTSRSRVRLRAADLPLIAASGLTGYFLYQMGFVLGLDRTTALASAILISTHPIFSVLFGWIIRRERPARMEIAGVLIAFAGVAVFLRVWDALAQATAGDLLSLGAAAAFGAYGVINQRLSPRYPPRALMAYTLAIGGLLTTLVGVPAIVRQDWGHVGGWAWVILVYAVVGPVYLAYSLWNWAIRRRGIPRTVVYGFLVPVVAGALAVAALGEHAGAPEITGAVLVVGGLVLTRFGKRVDTVLRRGGSGRDMARWAARSPNDTTTLLGEGMHDARDGA